MAGARPTIADVAREAGVSRTTVSHALNGIGKVDPRTRERVERVAAELGYRPSLRAQRLRRGEARTIGLVSSMPFAVAGGPSRLGFFMEVAAAAAESALMHGFALVLVPPVEADPPLDSLDIDGAIVVEPDADDSATKRLRDRGLPIVALGRQPGTDLPHVDLHAAAVVRLLLEHLREQGGRRIALLVGSARRHSYVDAAHEYRRFAHEHGMPELVVLAEESGGTEAGYAACADLLDRHPGVDAVCATVDAFAVGAVRALTDRGLRVPDDVMVATRYDGLRARTCEPPLTAVDLHLGQAAEGAVSVLLAEMRRGPARGEAPEVPVPPPVLVPRASSLRR
ncbi:LacI family transcriptional regulator [Saccharopolyspora erythraea NRRL 2338]|uniref:Transcriptional regulator, LacI-family n=2 Tax=Saccharopolyspora erythraea TaxID=1836 RepID=A4F7I4_SACEN|nr:LacI family DNA-binding transcriptional regulator [Saccharopolyspora erythraea]EQD84274.1 LacI family transcriptional regulator [Saccharopolyspora erythraea D]PFG93810.1 LacI family transcriptional regulator [Saccharopolyspora erythraea NRRL 2338]QRK90643.1 LacI family DNA-binding transcriptional regulator [Saccharopolyspora erythraea]CAM00008.1 transcriptional regulator, LacI-family [Saccharopolyspora erythraea NRRL 2338]